MNPTRNPDRPRYILGVSAFFHDAAAALIRDGEIIAAAQEERFTRVKGDASFPSHAIDACLKDAGITLEDVAFICFHEKPWLHFERLLETSLAYAPRGLPAFLMAMPIWLKKKLFLRRVFKKSLGLERPLLFSSHHESHMGAAFFPSPFERAAILTVDGVGEWATTAWGRGEGNTVTTLGELHFPHSLGLLYSAFTAYLGFRVNFGEYKLMGLAPYGELREDLVERILSELVDLRDDGSLRLNMRYFDFPLARRTTNERFDALFGGPPREPEAPLTQAHMDLARAIQHVTEEALLKMARHVHAQTGERALVLAGGVALNCVANGRLLREGPFEDIWIQPAAGDSGSAVGAALVAWHHYLEQPRQVATGPDGAPRDAMKGAYLGPRVDPIKDRSMLDEAGVRYRQLDDASLVAEIAQLIDEGLVVGHVHGRMEYGPRALGNRSILGDPRSRDMQRTMNLKIKFRESFRPFAPAVSAARLQDTFAIDRPTPYMLLVAPIQEAHRQRPSAEESGLEGLDRLNAQRSDLPAITHVDLSARIQSVDGVHNPRFQAILEAVEALTGEACVINTSFNVRGEPIVCSGSDAFRCFMQTEMDALVLEDLLILKSEQSAEFKNQDWSRHFDAD
jgi:carbamoyltransferase